ncbi:MAG: RNase adapter RapZ [Rhodospirillales bacterium]|nr:RNase adapter RapZ [Alphaproteobacteria bacterium]MCB9986687.1 RNase adapter RapZ [Rhodospirillales bacterium]USO06787.1 MAG: RNase adapter RapZ [Rhodospirillales bacterium]
MAKKKTRPRKIYLVTGLSGAGMSTALKIFEDMGYEVFDNFPLAFIPPLLADRDHADAGIVFGLDTRSRGFSPEAVLKHLAALRAQTDTDPALIFLSAANAVLQKRFSETRRGHPLAKDRPVLDGIRQERTWLRPLMDAADLQIDTSGLSIHDLRRALEASADPDHARRRLAVTVISFGFKNGVPRESDMVLDVRFLQNPHWIPALQPKTGLDKKVRAYVTGDDAYAPFMRHAGAMLDLLLPRYAEEGKFYFTLAVGCTGGRHRSVCVASELARHIADCGYAVVTRHRDMHEADRPMPPEKSKKS